MGKRKPLSLAEKQRKMLELFHETASFFTYKEVERLADKQKGKSPRWNDINVKVPITKDSGLSGELEIKVKHKGMLRTSTVAVGKGSLAETLAELDVVREITFVLADTNGGACGRAVVHAYTTVAKEVPVSVPNDFTPCLLSVHKITAHELKNVEIMGSKQDPYVVLEWDGDDKYTTEVATDAHTHATWDNISCKFNIDKESLEKQTIKVKVWDDNTMRSDKLIGEGAVSAIAAAAALGEVTELEVVLKDGTGRIVLHANTTEKPPPAAEIPDEASALQSIPDDFQKAVVRINKVSTHALKGTSMLSKLSPYVHLTCQDVGFASQLDTLSGVGPNATWDVLDLTFDVSSRQNAVAVMEVVVYEDNLVTDRVIGRGKIRITSACAKLTEDVMLEADLVDETGAVTGGSITLHLKATPPMKEVASLGKLHLSETFQQGILYVRRIKATNLKNVELVGKQDPYVSLKLTGVEGWGERTKALTDQGGEVVWDTLKVQAPVTATGLLEGQFLEVDVFDENSMRQDQRIGSIHLDLTRAAHMLGEEVEIGGELKGDKGQTTGHVVLVVEIREKTPEEVKVLPESFKEGSLRINRICTYDLKNTELVGKQDPYVVLSSGDWTAKTFAQIDAGGDVVWEYLQMAVPVTRAGIEGAVGLDVKAMDQNIGFDAFIGAGKTALSSINTLGEEFELEVPLVDKNNRSAGKVVMFATLEEGLPVATPRETGPVVVDKAFHTGQLAVHKVVGLDLKNTEFMGSQDPYVRLTLGDWCGQTKVQAGAGANPVWDLLDLEADVTKETLEGPCRELEVVVMDQNSMRADALIGTGSVTVHKVAEKVGQEVELKAHLVDKKGKEAGTLLVFCSLEQRVKEENLVVDPSFVFGQLIVDSIRTFDLKNMEWIGKQDPFVVLKMKDWEERTWTLDNAGGDVSWKNLDIRADVFKAGLDTGVMEVEVYDENNTGNTLIGTGSVPIKRTGASIGTPVELRVPLTDKKGKSAGRLTLFARAESAEVVQDLPTSFKNGELAVRRITARGLTNKELFGKSDPYVKLSLEGNDMVQTKVKSGEGDNVTWDNLDYKFAVTDFVLRGKDMLVEVFDENSLRADTLIGRAETSMKAAGASNKIGSSVEISVAIRDAVGRKTGRIILDAVLTEKAPEPEATLDLPKSFTVGNIRVTKVGLKNVKNTEWIGQPDPYVIFRLGKWAKRTPTSNNAGVNAVWSGLDLRAEVDRGAIANEMLSLEVFDDNSTRGDVLLGTSKISLRKLCKRMDREVKLKGDLDVMGKVCGEVELHVVLSEGGLEKASERIPEEKIKVEYGLLTVKSATGTFFSAVKQPALSVTLAGKTFESKPVEGKSPSCEFDLDQAVFNVTRDTLLFKAVEVSLTHKVMIGRKTRGTGQCTLRPVGVTPDTDVVLAMDVVDDELNELGTLRLVCSLKETAAPLGIAGQAPMVSAATISAVQTGSLLLDVMTVKATGLQTGSFFGNKSVNLKVGFSVGQVWKAMSFVNKGVKGSTAWNTADIYGEIEGAQATVHPLVISLLSVMDKSSAPTALGHARLQLLEPLTRLGEYVNLVGDLLDDHKKVVGKVSATCRFVDKNSSDGADLMNMPPLFGGDESMAPPVDTEAHERTRKELEDLKKMITTSREMDLDKLREEQASTIAGLKGMINALEAKLKDQNKKSRIGSMSDVRLPPNVAEWRASHVQAWISYKLDLPQYNGDFQEASVDGVVLLSGYIDDETLRTALNVENDLHRQKILLGIEELKTRQKEVDQDEAAKRKAAHEKKKALEEAREEERKLREKKEKERRDKEAKRLAKEEADAAKKEAKKAAKKAKKGKKSAKAKAAMKESDDTKTKTYAGEVREQNEIARVKMEREIRKWHKARAAKALKDGNTTWAFEYTGLPRPQKEADGVWGFGEAPAHKNAVSALLNSMEFRKGTLGNKAARSAQMAITQIPKTASTTEVLAIVKGAMYQVSGWLVDLEDREAERLLFEGRDLDALDDLDALVQTVGALSPPKPNTVKLSDIPTATAALALSDVSGGGAAGEGSEELPMYSVGGLSEELPEYSLAAEPSESELPEYTPAERESAGNNVKVPAPATESEAPETSTPAPFPSLNSLSPSRPTSGSSLPDSPAAKVRRILEKTSSRPTLRKSDRVGAIFRAFVGLQNNGAAWLGTNSKLTRIKFQGGFETILRLRIHWQQFDALWTMMDSVRSGDLDVHEFKRFFGDLSEFDTKEGTQTLSLHAGTKQTRKLTKYLYFMCDIFRNAGFTIMEMFSSFDRNGSGDVSVSEFCSMLRLLMNGEVDKKEIYNAMTLLDADGDKSISLDEILTFVYRVWRTQMDDLAERLAELTEGVDDKEIKTVVETRELIKEAIKKNFPRTWRDRLERQGHQLTGPFANLLKSMGIQVGEGGPVDSLGLTQADTAYYGNEDTQPSAAAPWKGLRYAKDGIAQGDDGTLGASKFGGGELKRLALKNSMSPNRKGPSRVGVRPQLPALASIELGSKGMSKEEIRELEAGITMSELSAYRKTELGFDQMKVGAHHETDRTYEKKI